MNTSENDSLLGESASAHSRVPTLTTATHLGTGDDSQAIVTPNFARYWVAWLISWLGIALSGGAFGFTIGLFIGVAELNAGESVYAGTLAGTLIAGVWAVPIAATVATLAWITGLARFRRASPLFAGACTGMISTAWILLETPQVIWMRLLILVAGVFGATGGYLPAALYWRKREVAECDAFDDRWQFSLRDLFLRFTVASVLLACWIFGLRWFFNR